MARDLCLRTPLGELYFENEAALLAQVADLLAQVAVIVDRTASVGMYSGAPQATVEAATEAKSEPSRAPHSLCADLSEAA